MNNVLLIVTDSLRADHAYDPALMPNLNRFADRFCTRYMRAYTTAPWTLAANQAILWGQYPSWIGVADHTKMSVKEILRFRRPPQRNWKIDGWVPKVLQDLGYRTVQRSGGGFVSGAFGFRNGFDFSEQYPWVYLDLDAFFETMKMAGQDDKPWFFYSQDFDCHEPYGEWERTAVSRDGIKNEDGSLRGFYTSADPDDSGYRLLAKSFYRNACTQYDEKLGAIFEYLEGSGMLESTVVIITTDHGEELWDFGWGGHTISVREPVVRVPLLLHYPQIPPFVSKKLVSHIDIAPTILDEDVRGEAGHLIFEHDGPMRPGVRVEVNFLEKWHGVVNPQVAARRLLALKAFISQPQKKWVATAYDDDHIVIEQYDLELDPEERCNIFKERQKGVPSWMN